VSQPFEDIPRFKTRLATITTTQPPESLYDIKTGYFLVTIDIRYGRLQRRTEALIERVSGKPATVLCTGCRHCNLKRSQMKKLKKSSVSLAWLARAKSAVAPVSARTTQDRLDLALPRGWPDSGSPVFWRWHRRGDKPQSGHVTDLRQVPEAARGARAYVWTPAVTPS